METVEVKAERREIGSKGKVKQLRRKGKIPGIFYGPKSTPVPLAIDGKDFVTRVAGGEGSHLIKLASQCAELANKVALVKEMQFHPVTGAIQHVDFYEVDLAEKIVVKVPLHFVGKAAGVIRGGILQPIVREIDVECLPMDIPEYIDVEVSALDIGDSLHISDVPIPAGVSAVYESDFPVVSVVPPTVEKAPAVEEAAPVEGAEAPEAAAEEKGKEEAGES
ncbi:MAG TPA: 50S ribosomal protein L25 [Candidatus Acidoferrales bacterium]|nr:50S ribosomal protein L25 [Candidatus Acidoferrales bacterium]